MSVLSIMCFSVLVLPTVTMTSISPDPIAVPRQNSYRMKPDSGGSRRPKMENI